MRFGAKMTSISIEQSKKISFVKIKSVKAREMVFAFVLIHLSSARTKSKLLPVNHAPPF